MEFTQSRFQDVFSRFYEMVCRGIWFLVFALVLSLVSSTDTYYIILSLVSAAISTCYFLYKYKDGSKSLHLSEEQFSYIDGDTISKFYWEDYEGYIITKTIPYQVIINNHKYGKTRFSYYAFSSKQRKNIFKILQSK